MSNNHKATEQLVENAAQLTSELAETYPDQLPPQILNEIEGKLSTIIIGEAYSVNADNSLASLIVNDQSGESLRHELPEPM